MESYQLTFAQALHTALQGKLSLQHITNLLETPRRKELGDAAFPCFTLAKELKISPVDIAQELAEAISHPAFEKVEAHGPYVNVFFHRLSFSAEVLSRILREGEHYGDHDAGNGATVTIDLSSPNIAKPFSMGHLRSTVIGASLSHLAEKNGYVPIRINYLGDWGTQFGKLITAYLHWGDEDRVRKQPIIELLALYVMFHEKAQTNPALNDEARLWFKKLEDGDEQALQLWKWFRDESIQSFQKTYDLLSISFHSYNGEAFYNDKIAGVVNQLRAKGLLTLSDGAEVVSLEEHGLPPCLIVKRDGASTYAVRDLAAAIDRYKTYHFKKSLYVVGPEQSLHFQQVMLVLEKMGYTWAKEMIHIPFGFILKEGKKMSTRKGKIILLEEVIAEAISLARQTIELKNPTLPNKEVVAKQIGVGSLIFHDLKNDRLGNVEFSLQTMLAFEGDTALYLQYTHARACSLLRKVTSAPSTSGLCDDHSFSIVKHLSLFPVIVQNSFSHYEPSQLAKYAIQLAHLFNAYYSAVRILTEDSERDNRLALVKSVTIVLKESLRLLGVQAPEEL
ncbi:arginyl-tRNA ligase [Fictibacillus macauensis ZFHKF-1]|uniref:Arginine--tRNA ligase n=1 Tax=Fictibacillus macauensis ZFHKF-1 TaxID=1196324 RepID=I8IWQ5_9BACL|nr:arginine--tRNA ligase [Fictibacillus macauensis]EIT83926.1 arginyl-tRNA ligase [Fictibacillus macauensis ZFHKF-1]